MSTKGGPNRVNEGLEFSLDASSRGFTKFGTGGTNNSHRKLKSKRRAGYELSLDNTSRLSGKTYYTIYGITYPESSYTPASRDGITPGFNNTTGTKLYDCSRDLNYFVFDEDTNTWVSDSYFNGERISGHCYDTYDGQPSQHAKFQQDFDVICSTFPNATHIVIGSHAAENNVADSNTRARLESIGLPADHTSGTRFEYILVGKRNKPWTHHYVRENVSSAVAHMNLALPLEKGGDGLTFDGTDDYIFESWPSDLNYDDNTTPRSWETVFKTTSTSTYQGIFGHKVGSGCSAYCNGGISIWDGRIRFIWYDNSAYRVVGSVTPSTNTYYHVVATFDTDAKPRIYVNGSLNATWSSATNLNYGSGMLYVDIGYNSKSGGRHYFAGEIVTTNFYAEKALTPSEVLKNYRAYQKRLGI